MKEERKEIESLAQLQEMVMEMEEQGWVLDRVEVKPKGKVYGVFRKG